LPAVLLVFALLLPLASCARRVPGTGHPGVSLQSLRRHVQFLASDRLAGREVGTPGIALAEQYVARWFASCGLEPLPGSRSFFQEFTLYKTGFAVSSLALSVAGPGGSFAAAPGVDFRPFDFSAEGFLAAPVVFAGYGITAPEFGWDDYTGLDAAGKFVLLLRHEPRKFSPRGPSSRRSPGYTHHALFRTKAENALRHGAAGMLLVDDPLTPGPAEELTLRAAYALVKPAKSPEEGPIGNLLAAHIGPAPADLLIRPTGLALKELQEALDAGRKPVGFPLGEPRARLQVPPRETTRVSARNAVGFLAGADPKLRNQWILIGAHHDHLGTAQGTGDTIYNGADDNASGVAGVLALAWLFRREGSWREEQAAAAGTSLAARAARELAGGGREIVSVLGFPPRPSRSLVFATFSAEEEGLLGSRVLARELSAAGPGHPALALNLDMIGRNPGEPTLVLGTGSAPQLRALVERADALPSAGSGAAVAAPGVRFSAGDHEGGSDQASFAARGVPYLFFFTGLNPEYHTPADEASLLDYARLGEVVGLAWRVASLLADAPEAH
jgi:hypothetical protein